MATVSITDKLKSAISNQISNMRNKEVQAEYPNVTSAAVLDASELFNRIEWGQHLHLMPQLPMEWKRQHDSVTIQVKRDDTDNTITQIEFKGCRTACSVPNKSGWNSNYTSIKESAVDMLPDNLMGVTELRQRIIDHRGVVALNAKWKKIDDDVEGLLNQCGTLNQALKAVPTLRLYVPREYLDRVDAKVARAGKATIEVKFDVDQLTAAAIGAQLAGA